MASAGTGSHVTDSELEKMLVRSQQPSSLLKCSGVGKPAFRDFILSSDFKSLLWFKDGSQDQLRGLQLDKVKEVRVGQRTDRFRNLRRPSLESLSFSIVFDAGDGTDDTLDLVCKDVKQFEFWTTLLRELLQRGIPDNVREGAIRKSIFEERRWNFESKSTANLFAERQPKLSVRKPVAVTQLPQSPKSLKERTSAAAPDDMIELFVCGQGGWGQLGRSSLACADIPASVPITSGRSVASAAFGWAHSIVVMQSGAVITAGNRVGTGLEGDCFAPAEVEFKQARPASLQASAGHFHNLLLSQEKELWVWGSNLDGQLGLGHCDSVPAPARLELKHRILSVACGASFSMAVPEGGGLLAWGTNAHGCLGLGEGGPQLVSSPTSVPALDGLSVQQVACGDLHSLAVTEQEGIMAWGWNGCGQLGIEPSPPSLSRPTQIAKLRGADVVSIACGAAHSLCVVATEGGDSSTVYAWGSNRVGQLGLDQPAAVALGFEARQDLDTVATPTAVRGFGESVIVAVTAGAFHSMAVAEDGAAFSAGLNNLGQLGHNKSVLAMSPVFEELLSLEGKCVRHATAHGFNTALLVADMGVARFTEICLSCRAEFSVSNRKHYCRNCGRAYDGKCTTNRAVLLWLGTLKPSRVCDLCFRQLQA